MLKPFSMRTYSGHMFDVVNVDRRKIDIVDIAHQLSMQCRFYGASRRFYSVAEHCVLGSFTVKPEHALPFLLHDASEAYLHDMITPMKDVTPTYQQYEAHLQSIIEEHYGIDTQSEECRERVHAADKWMAMVEGQELVQGWDWVSAIPFRPIVRPVPDHFGMTPHAAKFAFLKRFVELDEVWVRPARAA